MPTQAPTPPNKKTSGQMNGQTFLRVGFLRKLSRLVLNNSIHTKYYDSVNGTIVPVYTYFWS